MASDTPSPIDRNTPSPAALRLAMDLDTPIDLDPSLTRVEAAAFLNISKDFLKKLDLAGRGPVAVRIGRRWTYLRSDLIAFRASMRSAPVPKLAPAVVMAEPANDPAELVQAVEREAA